MGFFQILRSIEDLLYEIMAWLVFYPRTLWRIISHPVQMSDYSNIEQSESLEQQYTDTLSPPLFLILTIFLAHSAEVSFGVAASTSSTALGKLISGSEETMLLFRAVIFSLFPLTFAVAFLKRSDKPLDRPNLRAPFFSQCYPASIFAILTSAGSILLQFKTQYWQVAGIVTFFGAILWYVSVQTRWLSMQLSTGTGRASGIAIWTFLKATFFSAIASALFFV
jgi:hypothetical protein